ncbi:OmpA family protein [Magnetospirillum sp. SS-4]|uniref:OmpA family protein n=1 Tax=Magnetospirillum sp. SS-4 TaxID=2681465 RepID=UPI00137EE061|nr:OmpA family protein [Magnetospirillum sp. SS-4]CAA7612985.1 Outer membrane protein [Magnetospirillum sp. SS-4]
MRSIKTLLVATAIAAVPALAQAQWYVGLDAGAQFLQDSDNSGTGLGYKSESDIGWLTQGQIGHAFGPWRLEGELSYRSSGIDTVGGTSGSGDTTALGLMVNGLYHFMPQSSWHPFVGAGIGAAQVDAGSVKRNNVELYSGDDWQFAYQGFAGLAYDVSKDVELKAQYRYFATLDYETKAANGTALDSEYRDHAVLIGFTYKFNPPPVAAPAPAPAPMPVAAPAPAPAPKPMVAKNFIVFFDFDKAAVTPEADRVIQQAAAAAKSTGAARIDLTGHTDTSGSDKYNQALSLKRAEAVKAQLVRQGVPAGQIITVAKGESSPMVKTPDGVREPQNRRVEIVLP